MDVDNDSKDWSLFENRPAKERTSAPTAGRPSKSTTQADKRRPRRPRLLRVRTDAENVKC
jgi:hypothetical protein